METFVNNIEEYIYKSILVYRSILITNNEHESFILHKLMVKNDHYPIIINTIDEYIDYNNIDNRIIIITISNFIQLINHLNKDNNIIDTSSYNFIAFSYTIGQSIINKMILYYMELTDNNLNNTIILDKNYYNMLYLQNNIS